MFSSDEVVSTIPRVKDIMMSIYTNPNKSTTIVGAKVLSDQNVLYILLLVHYKYHTVKCHVVGRRIFLEECSEWYIVYVVSIVKVKYTS